MDIRIKKKKDTYFVGIGYGMADEEVVAESPKEAICKYYLGVTPSELSARGQKLVKVTFEETEYDSNFYYAEPVGASKKAESRYRLINAQNEEVYIL